MDMPEITAVSSPTPAHTNGQSPHSMPSSPSATPHAHAVVISAHEVEERAIRWLWPPYVALAKLCVLDGDPGTGKTLLATVLAACVSRGKKLPGKDGQLTESPGEPGITLFVAAEDDIADTLKPRLRQAGADESKIKFIDTVRDARGRERYFTLEHLPLLAAEVQRYQPPLVYIDSLQAVLGGKVDTNRANQVTELLIPLRQLAERYNTAIIFARHPAKPGQNTSKLIHRGMGSQAFIGGARLGLYVEEHPCDDTKVLLVQSKSNAGEKGITQVFSKQHGVFEWCGVTRINATMLAGPGRGPTPHAFLEACFWLEEQLMKAPQDNEGAKAEWADELEGRAKEAEISHRQLYAAKNALKIVSVKVHDRWIWILPPL
jgi:archaellum biogenesis ATPase FlaH